MNIDFSRGSLKKKVVRIIVLAACLMESCLTSFSQQNIQFSQYIFNTLAVNPAYAGYKEAWYLQAGHRMQWAGMDGAPTTTQISIDGVTDVFRKNIGLGLQLTADRLGAQSATSLYTNYAYRLQLDDADMSRLCLGLAVGATQYATDMSILEPTDQNDPILTEGISNSLIPDLRFGLYYYNAKFFAGLSVLDMLSAQKVGALLNLDVDSTRNLMRNQSFYLLVGGIRNLNSFVRFRPSLMIREDLKGPTNLDLSASFVFGDRFWLAADYRTGIQLWEKNYTNGASLSNLDAVCFVVQFQVTDRFRLGYSCDYALNQLNNFNNLTHELSLGWVIPGKARRILSPRFF